MCGHCFVPVYKTYKKDKIRDIVTLECPYCGVEVCFDEIKGEAAKGQIDELKDSVVPASPFLYFSDFCL